MHLGTKVLVTTSEGEKIDNCRYFDKSKKKIVKLQRKLSRKTSGGKNFEQTRIRLARAYEHAKNQKTDTLHKLSTRLVREYDVISVRDTDLMAAMRNPKFAKLFADAGWGEFMRHLKYKCEWYEKKFVKIDAFFPSVQLCSSCEYKHKELGKKLFIQRWSCPCCGTQHTRGVNAAINVKNEGLRLLTI